MASIIIDAYDVRVDNSIKWSEKFMWPLKHLQEKIAFKGHFYFLKLNVALVFLFMILYFYEQTIYLYY